MSLFFYTIFLKLYSFAVRLIAFKDNKARLWVKGRKNWRQKISQPLQPGEKRIWIHAASLGEFEQGRPVIEKIKQEYPSHKIVLSFFSPSGYEIIKGYNKADYIFYLPMDGKKNANDFVSLVNPALTIFIKYEFWYYYLHTLKQKNIPTLLISAAFRKGQPFFKWYGRLFKKMLACYSAIFVQDEPSKQLAKSISVNTNITVAGDTRYDRVAGIAASIKPIPVAEKFKQSNQLIIAGSTWPGDEKIIKECITNLPHDWKMVIAPHETDTIHIKSIMDFFGNDAVLFSQFTDESVFKKILVINNIGMLSSLYAYGEIAFIGGGFQKGGIHNILEPAVFGLPVIFGPVYQKFAEANTLVNLKFAFPVHNSSEAVTVLHQLINDKDKRLLRQTALKKFMQENVGATQKIMSYIKEHNLLM